MVDLYNVLMIQFSFMKNDIGETRNLELILSTFKQLSGLKINFHKRKFFCVGEAQDDVDQYAELFGYAQGLFIIIYLGIPIHYRRLTYTK
jgi:hypothetical protein